MLWINFSIKNFLSLPSIVFKLKSFFVFTVWRIRTFSLSSLSLSLWFYPVVKFIKQIFSIFVWIKITLFRVIYSKRRWIALNIFFKAVTVGKSFWNYWFCFALLCQKETIKILICIEILVKNNSKFNMDW